MGAPTEYVNTLTDPVSNQDDAHGDAVRQGCAKVVTTKKVNKTPKKIVKTSSSPVHTRRETRLDQLASKPSRRSARTRTRRALQRTRSTRRSALTTANNCHQPHFPRIRNTMASNGSYQTYDQVGIAEDVSDIISNISPTKTPFQTAIGNEKIDSTCSSGRKTACATRRRTPRPKARTRPTPLACRPSCARTALRSCLRPSRSPVPLRRVKTYGRAREMAYQMEKVPRR
jgi:hypothetical protein